MAAFAKRNNARSLVGLQGAVCSDVRTIEELVTAGRVGKVLSSSSTCSMGIGGATEQWIVDYFTERAIGGNMLTIGVGHAMEYMEYGESPRVSYLCTTDFLIITSSRGSRL